MQLIANAESVSEVPDDFAVTIDDYSLEGDQLTINWSVSHKGVAEEFVIHGNGIDDVAVEADVREYTFTVNPERESFYVDVNVVNDSNYISSDSIDLVLYKGQLINSRDLWEDYSIEIDDFEVVDDVLTVNWSPSNDIADSFHVNIDGEYIDLGHDVRSHSTEVDTSKNTHSIQISAYYSGSWIGSEQIEITEYNGKYVDVNNYFENFAITIDNITSTSTSITVDWSATHDIVEEFELNLDGVGKVTFSGDTTSHTFKGLEAGREYNIEISAKTQYQDWFNYYDYDYIETDWSDSEKTPVHFVYIINEEYTDIDYMRIRGLDEISNFEYEDWFYNSDNLSLPYGKYEIAIYDHWDLSKSTQQTFEIKEGIDYIKNPIQFQIDTKEMNEQAEPFEYAISDVTEGSFKLSWNNVSKIMGFRISMYDDEWNSIDYEFDNNVTEYTVNGLKSNLKYYISFYADYMYDLVGENDLYVKTNGADAKEEKLSFENALYEAAVKKDIGLYDRSVTVADMKDLTNLIISNSGVETLEHLELAKKLNDLTADNNEISDISVLAELVELDYVYLDNNNISDIHALKDLTSLYSLYLSNNSITNIDALKNLVNLSYLSLDSNNISDISVLSDLANLDWLSLGDNKISDISSLEKLTALYYLELNDNEIENITTLAELDKLEELFLYDNEIVDIASLGNLTNLETLNLSSNKIATVTDLSELVSLDYLDLSNNRITDISVLGNLTSLEYLNLTYNDITDISVLKKLPNLQYVYLWDNDLGEDQKETLEFLCEEGVYVSSDNFDCEYGWNDWEDDEDWNDEEDIVIDVEEVKEKFPADQGFIVSDDGKSVTFDLEKSESKETAKLSTEQIELLKKNNQAVTITKDDVQTKIPASAFGDSDEPVEINVNELGSETDAFSSTYDFTITQGDKTISQFGKGEDGVTLTFNVNPNGAKNPHNLKVFYYNEETDKWEKIGGRYSSNGSVTVVVTHFSKFAVFEAENDVDGNDNIVGGEPEGNKPGGGIPGGNNKPGENTDEETPNNNNTEKETDNDPKKETDNNSEKEDKDSNVIIPSTSEEADANADSDAKENVEGKKLDNTATNTFNILLAGFLVMLIGVAMYVVNHRRMHTK